MEKEKAGTSELKGNQTRTRSQEGSSSSLSVMQPAGVGRTGVRSGNARTSMALNGATAPSPGGAVEDDGGTRSQPTQGETVHQDNIRATPLRRIHFVSSSPISYLQWEVAHPPPSSVSPPLPMAKAGKRSNPKTPASASSGSSGGAENDSLPTPSTLSSQNTRPSNSTPAKRRLNALNDNVEDNNEDFDEAEASKSGGGGGGRAPAKRTRILKKVVSQEGPSSEELTTEEVKVICLPFVSIHWFPVEELKSSFKLDANDEDNLELKIIQKIMEEINSSSRQDYEEEQITPEIQNTHGFKNLFFTRTTTTPDAHCEAHGIIKESTSFDKLDFLYRPGAIFCLTSGQHGWSDIQKYACFDFPDKIMSRLTGDAGKKVGKRPFVGGVSKIVEYSTKLPIQLNEITSVSENVIKPVRKNSSIYSLQEFEPLKKKGVEVNIEFGLTGVRIHRDMDPNNIPELLDHLVKIMRGPEQEKTFEYGTDLPETDQKMRRVRAISNRNPLAKVLNDELVAVVHRYVNGVDDELLERLEVCPSQLSKFFNACKFSLRYSFGGNYVFQEKELRGCPPKTEEIFKALRQLTRLQNLSLKDFHEQIDKLKLVSFLNGTVWKRVNFINLLMGELSLNGKIYWKISGKWMYYSAGYHHLIDKEFLEILNMKTQHGSESILFESAAEAKLPISWEGIQNKVEYAKLYGNFDNRAGQSCYLVPPAHYTFDLMYIEGPKNDDDLPSISLFYFVERFDSGTPSTSTLIQDTIAKICKSGQDLGAGPGAHHLRGFYDHHRDNDILATGNIFQRLFPRFEDFRACFDNSAEKKVSIVVGLVTGRREWNVFTLQREKNLPRKFTRDNVRPIVEMVGNDLPGKLEAFRVELEMASVNLGRFGDLTAKLLKLLTESKYCVGEEGELSGELLKLRCASDFKLFRDKELNEFVFRNGILRRFLTGFPGFKHKLEVLEIWKQVVGEQRFQLRLVEIFGMADNREPEGEESDGGDDGDEDGGGGNGEEDRDMPLFTSRL